MDYWPWLAGAGGSAVLFALGVWFWPKIEDYFLGFLATCFAGLGILAGLIAWGALNVEQHACHETGDTMNVSAKYDGNTGCWLKIDGRWINEDNYRDTTQHPAILG